jgi:Domain of Unknown Function (DUF1080)
MQRMRQLLLAALMYVAASGVGGACGSAAQPTPAADGWISLFDGKTLDGWRASEKPGTFRVEDGAIVVEGPRSHLFYVGPVESHTFTNFEWKADVMTMPKANSGMYFHTEYQESGWPSRGYEVQVNNTHPDPRKTGSLYAIQDVREALPDNQWFTQHITVQGKRIVVRLNGKVVVDYTEPDNVERPPDMAGRKLSRGTLALQGHDPGSKVLFKNIMVKPLP